MISKYMNVFLFILSTTFTPLWFGLFLTKVSFAVGHPTYPPRLNTIFTSDELPSIYDIVSVEQNEDTPYLLPQQIEGLKYNKNNLIIGKCTTKDQHVYSEHTVVENTGPSILNGTLEIYIDGAIKITCVKVENLMTETSAATPSYNAGGVDHNWVFIDVACKYGKGFNMKIDIYGVTDPHYLTKSNRRSAPQQ